MNTVWVDIFKVGAEIHGLGNETVRVTDSFASQLVANFTRFKARGETVPVLREHQAEGYQYGTVHDLRVHGGYVQGALEFFREDDRKAYNRGLLREFSPGFIIEYTDPHTGAACGPHIVEVSFTALAYQRNLRPPQQTNPGVQLAASRYVRAPSPRQAMNDRITRLCANAALKESEDAQIGFDIHAELGEGANAVDLCNELVARFGSKRAGEIAGAWTKFRRDGSLWTVREAARFLKLSQDRVGRLATAGDIPSIKIGGSRRYSPLALRQFAALGSVNE